jgi:hypothetical protein
LYDFYYFLGRLYRSIDERIHSNNPALPPLVSLNFSSRLKSVLEAELLDSIKDDTYFDDFLGNSDDQFHPDDRLFSTSLALNALLDLNWNASIGDINPSVVQAMNNSALWLTANIFNEREYLPHNAFFSGSSKGASSQPFFYPMNFEEYLNGTVVSTHSDPSVISADFIGGVSGVIPAANYTEMINDLWFGVKVPLAPSEINANSFPFWCSPTLTYAITLLALAKYQTKLGTSEPLLTSQ